MPPVNFARDVVDAADPARIALVTIDSEGRRERAPVRRGGRWRRAPGGHARGRGGAAGGRGHDRDRQPAGVGAGAGGVLPHRRRGAAVHRAAARGRPAGAHGRGRAEGRAVRRTQRGHGARRRLRRHAADRLRRAAAALRPRPGRRPGRARPGADGVHLGHVRHPEADPPRPALPGRPARPGRALVRRPPRRAGLVHRRQRLVEVGPQLVHRPVAARAPPRCCTTPASIPPSAWS